MNTKLLRMVLAAVLTVFAMSSVACVETPDLIGGVGDVVIGVPEHVLGPLIPPDHYSDEMYTLTRTKAQQYEQWRRIKAMNKREMREDWNAFWLWDHPQQSFHYAP